ncbi:16S rRNA (cytosine(967)-C(5))-methyltransferase RsmB [Evansella cellulosilytica]|uniref:16S rRNA (cytosine(967)-C(5))-methyltransferase n=1 Tax=Evansella cellulosilytica (strain ATCC 21833 / DSM 2522 / FERM P-1141 / JCM 9156 / N-4) TaxID=649639 RepID=E6TTP0_EVAC2|nr:16S rRNA (cytosine(967)-C(5))-methyltransferase RsmB [Evansella cellulosilytica]ADU30809.1 sun protein [Evansella cellulosilytica DSM 2522]
MKQGNVRDTAVEVLLKIEKQQAYSHLLLNETIKKSNLNQKDVPLLTELVYGTIQYQKLLDFYLKPFSKRPLEKLEPWVLVLLRLTLYQMVYLDRIPDRAAVHEAVQIAKKRGHQGISGMVNGILRSIQRNELPQLDTVKDPVERLALKTSHPEWLIKRWIDQYGIDKTEEMALANLTHPTHSVRVNELNASVEEVIAALKNEGIEAEQSKNIPESVLIYKGSVINTKPFVDGWITVQDEGSMLVAHALSPKENERVLDACAAPGGKSTHIAEKMKNSGQIVSLDIHKHKVGLIEKNAKRLNLSIINTEQLDARQVSGQFEEHSFDRILVDAPCSGLGVIQRKPDLKWSKNEGDINRLAQIQTEILEAVWPLLKKGGTLVYSTCTVDKEENNEVITQFVQKKENAQFDDQLMDRLPKAFHDCKGKGNGMIQLFPGEQSTDGFFISSVIKS